MRTHYDNLKVAENAPEEVIRAAYKALSQKHHPDKNSGNPDSHGIMQIINDAYGVLGDPERRRQYDEFLRRSRVSRIPGEPVIVPRPRPNRTQSEASPGPVSKRQQKRSWIGFLFGLLFWDLRLTLFLGIMGYFAYADWIKGKKPAGTNLPSVAASEGVRSNLAPVMPAYVRPNTAPNGYPWPQQASYISGANLWATGGLSSVTVDNSRNNSDVYVKLKIWRDGLWHDVRECFIPAFSSFSFAKVVPGLLEVRYRDLDTGAYAKTAAFSLTETRTYSGTNYSDLTLTLYKVANGNMQTSTISEHEF